MLVDTCLGPREMDEKPYWHLVPAVGAYAMTFYNNVMVGKGALSSVSAWIEADPAIANAQTGYSAHRSNDPKEVIFEQIRQQEYSGLPSRIGKTIYLFDDYSLAQRAQTEWFANAPKIVHECRVIKGTTLHRADSAWLNCPQQDWVSCARNYWGGRLSSVPFPEILVHGAIYFPEYRSFPSPARFLPKPQ